MKAAASSRRGVTIRRLALDAFFKVIAELIDDPAVDVHEERGASPAASAHLVWSLDLAGPAPF